MSLNEFYISCAHPKVYREKKAPAPKKPAEKGPVAKERHKKKLAQARTKSAIREQVRELDGYRCRWPECSTDPETAAGALEVAHWKAEGSGGDPLLARYEPENLITLCAHHHRLGARSIHSGYASMDPMSELGMRGPVLFTQLENSESARRFLVGLSLPPKKDTE